MIKTQAPTGSILTYSGRFVNPLEITPEDIRLIDIAHALSHLCRYNGHVDHFYSVAQHSVYVARQFEPGSELRKWGLLHDATEAYLGDVVAPLKYCGHYDFYLEAEDKLMEAIAEKFNLEGFHVPDEVDFVDKKLRGAEMRDLKGYFPESSQNTYDFEIRSWLPSSARQAFIWEAIKLGLEFEGWPNG